MRRGLLIAVVAGILVVAGVVGFVWFSGGSGEPTTGVTAPPVSTTTTFIASAPAEDSTTTTTEGDVPASGPVTYELTGESVASFTLQEDLRGQRTTVVGTTSNVVAQLIVDPSDPATARLGEIIINARTLETGTAFRDRAIRGQILESADDAFEFITFMPTSLEGLPDDTSLPFTFQIIGQLTIRDITQQVTFDVVIEEASATGVVGTATAQVLREEFGLVIPSVPNVANVTEEVNLELFFVAEPVG